MKRTVLAAALLAAFAIPAFADDAVKTKDRTTNMSVDPATTASTTATQSDMPKTVVKKSGCMNRNTAAMM